MAIGHPQADERERTAADVVIVGGGPAGLTTALALVRAAPDLASRVVVLEKATYPRDKYCAGAFGGRGEAILRALDAVPDVPSAVAYGMSFRGAGRENVCDLGRPVGRVVRRIEFDHALARIVAARGIAIREGVRVVSVRESGAGAVVETSAGPIAAKVVVGADGVGSAVRRSMGLGPGAYRAQVLEVDTPAAPGETDRRILRFDLSDRNLPGYYWDFPTIVDGVPLVCRGVYRLRLPHASDGAGSVSPASDDADAAAAQNDLRDRLAARLRPLGIDLATVKNKRFAERGYEPARTLARGRCLLVGEAAGIDPVTGEGIAQAVEYGAMAGSFVARALKGETPLDAWTAEVRKSRLGIDLRLRTWIARWLFGHEGKAREPIERFMADCHGAVVTGTRHFAGFPHDPVALGDLAFRGGYRFAREAVTRGLAERAARAERGGRA